MTRALRSEYRSLAKSRTALKRKLKDARAHHRPTDRIIAQMQETTTSMLRIENGMAA